MTQSIQIKKNSFVMHAAGVLFWKENSTLLISDVHLGKISHFRKFGAAVPQKAVRKNFELLTKSVNFFKPKVLCFMGDLFHSSLNKEWQLFELWVKEIQAEIILISGNHDIISPLKYEALNIKVVEEIEENGFLLTHHPEDREGLFNFSGHIHPAVHLQGIGRQSLRLSCFYKLEHQMILPAFGAFTGTHVLAPKTNSEIYAIAEDEVFLVSQRKAKISFSRKF